MLVLLAALAALDYFGGDRSEVEALSLSREDLPQRENPAEIYWLHLRLPDGERRKIEVPISTPFKPDARLRLLRVEGGLSGRISYEFIAYLEP